MLKRTFPSLLALLAPVLLVAQNTGTLRLLVDPGHNFEFIVDKKHRMQQREITLTEGLHHFSLWAPERVILDTSVFVVADRTSDLVVRLRYSAEYAAYRKELSQYKSARRKRAWTPVLLGAGMVWTGLSAAKYIKAGDALDQAVADYGTSNEPGVIYQIKKNTIPQHNDELKKAKTSLIMGSALTVLGAGLVYYMRATTKGLQQPTFEDKEKVRFDGLAWVPDRNGAFWSATFSMPLAR